MNIIQDLPPQLPDNTYVAIDTEIFGLKEKTMHRPRDGKFAALTACYQPGTVYIIQDQNKIPSLLEQISNCVWIIQHAKFDLTHLRRWATIPQREKLIDTMLMERLLWNNYYDNFDLASMTRRYLFEHLDKTPQKEFESATELTPELLEYSVKDADATLRVWLAQKEELTKTLMKVWRWIDLPALWTVLDFRGFRLDVDAWKQLAINNRAKVEEIDHQLPFNSRSPKQVVEYLRKNGFKKLEDSQEDTLHSAIRKFPDTDAAKVAELVLESRMYTKRASTYGESWLDDYLEWFPDDNSYGFVADYWVTGAETGRMSASDPPMHQIPSRDTKDFRKCFIARPGCKLILADYSQQEVFIMAYLSQDKRLIEICNSGQDIYTMVAQWLWGVEIDRKDPRRARAKSVVLGTDYGMSKYGLARRENISTDDADALISKFKATFPGVASWMNEQIRIHNYVTTIAGRRAWLNPYSSQKERNALNSPIQGSAAEITKLAASAIHQGWKWDCPFGMTGIYHDEFVLDVPEQYADSVAKFVHDVMVDTGNYICPGMSFRADVCVADNWSEKE